MLSESSVDMLRDLSQELAKRQQTPTAMAAYPTFGNGNSVPLASKVPGTFGKSRKTIHVQRTPGEDFVHQLMAASYVLAEDWEGLAPSLRKDITQSNDNETILAALVEHGLLTEYQARRIEAGITYGLVLGNYRVLDRLGAGGMGVVFKGEHLDMRRFVAIKVFQLSPDQDPRLLSRFHVEMRAVAQLHHPNIVAAMDAGTMTGPPGSPVLRYFVMEYVPGQDLEDYVNDRGPLAPLKACDLAHQVAGALAEVHKYKLVHRDIKPSNILVTPEEQAKLLDFGLARHFDNRMTEPGIALGTIDFMAPEQARDASKVDIRADIYGLGGTLFWCLTGRMPFPAQGSIAEDLARRFSQPPPSVRETRPEIPAELDTVVARMMAITPDDRYSDPQSLMRALLAFIRPECREHLILKAQPTAAEQQIALRGGADGRSLVHQVLIVDDESGIRSFCKHVLQADWIQCDEAVNGAMALEIIKTKPYDLVLLDVDMPETTGVEVLKSLRESPPCPHLKVIMFSGRSSSDEMAQLLLAGADDYLTKPFSLIQLQGRVKTALRLKDAQDRSELLNQHLLAINAEQERSLNARDSDLVHARNALVLALAKLVEHRDNETGAHLVRVQKYCRILGEEAAQAPAFKGQIDQHFIEMVECCAPLHDIGKLGLPDHILMKPGKLTSEERILMQAHTTIGADTLNEVAKQHGFARAFLQTAIDITRHHHERYDGTGYPDRLAGSAIPLSARIVAVGDVYDALRSRRVYKPALSHLASLQLMVEASTGHFDPALLLVLQRCAPTFEKVFHEFPD
jgi:response regulator RpfG family c-di-GMP phosphodiesterase/serine/threonine protein kinase